jgi:hypothetical protein
VRFSAQILRMGDSAQGFRTQIVGRVSLFDMGQRGRASDSRKLFSMGINGIAGSSVDNLASPSPGSVDRSRDRHGDGCGSLR